MGMKSILKYALLLFVVLSIGFLVLSGGEQKDQKTDDNSNQKIIVQKDAKPPATNEADKAAPAVAAKPSGENISKECVTPQTKQSEALQKPSVTKNDLILAYYFHGNYRCHTCRTIESLAYKTVSDKFAVELQAGEIVWQEINIEQPENRHFVEDFQLFSSSLVIVRKEGDKVLDWKILQDVWRLVRDESKFTDYVAKEIKDFKERKI